ncbi:MAG: hypothetical protein DRI90_05920 [Deltaproteobacteria bacterium]|nr:MAG: hypothetical protein DRI90_05920 [Deltaproteobacteria bacterium]
MGSLPDKLGRYPIVGLLATGGMAEILLGKVVGAAGFERPVVVKRVLTHLARQKSFIDMFIDEARIVASIRHPNVVDVHEFGRDGDELFLVMEYLEGESAAALIRRLTKTDQPLNHVLGAHIVAEACAGLHAAHELTAPDGTPQHLVHRDVSPHNLFLTYLGRVKVIDFGVALTADRLARTSAGHVKGKFGYMSPEQCLSEPLDRRSDIFSLGIVLFELTTGKRLFKRKNELLTLQAIFQEPIPKPSDLVAGYPAALETVVMRALSKRREERYETTADMRVELIRASHELPFEGVASDTLASLMSEIFATRMARKADMLKRVAAGWSFASLPGDVLDNSLVGQGSDGGGPDDDWAASGEAAASWQSQSHGAAAQAVAASMAPEGSLGAAAHRRRRWLIAGGAVALLAGGAVAVAKRPSQTEPQSVVSSTAPETIPSQTAAPVPTAAPSASTAARSEVTITVATSPVGARVTIRGVDQGVTPVSFSVPQAHDELELAITSKVTSPSSNG